jgi:hypothetical protein
VSDNNAGEATDDFLSNPDKWHIPCELLSTDVPNPDDESDELIEDKDILWTQFVPVEQQAQETEKELAERKEAIQDQIKAGILKVAAPDIDKMLEQPFLGDGRLNPHLAKMVQENTINKRWQKRRNGKGQEVVGPTRPVSKARQKKIGPNDPCPCGSGKKFKKCHGKGKGFVRIA